MSRGSNNLAFIFLNLQQQPTTQVIRFYMKRTIGFILHIWEQLIYFRLRNVVFREAAI